MINIMKGQTIEIFKICGKHLPKGLRHKFRQATYDILRELNKIKKENVQAGNKH